MKEDFYDYLNNLYWVHIKFAINKKFSIYSTAYNSEDLCIWEYDNCVYVSDADDYVIEYHKAYMLNKDNALEFDLPNLLYQSENNKEIKEILNTLFIRDYEVMIQELMNLMHDEKTLSLVDNDNMFKYN